MKTAVASMLARYKCRSTDDYTNALREILQEIALLGLWRSKFFNRAAFYGGTALRVLYGLDRYSEDMDFSLLTPDPQFDIAGYLGFIEAEVAAFGFHCEVQRKNRASGSAIDSAFLKSNTQKLMLIAGAGEEVTGQIPSNQVLRIKIEIDVDPPADFTTEAKYLLQPLPFSVLAYDAPSLFAGKMHAVLCRSWKRRVKGRDWYDLVWYVGRGVALDLTHLEQRMRQSGHYKAIAPLTKEGLVDMLADKIESLDIDRARADVARFVTDPGAIEVWSRDFFLEVASRIAFRSMITP